MKRFFSTILLFVALFVAQNASAQLKTSYFMEGSYFRTDLNPALTPTRGYVALPLISEVSAGFYSNYASFENMYFERNGEYVHGLDASVPAAEFLSNLPNSCVDYTNVNVGLFKWGFYTLNRTFYNFGVNYRLDSRSVLPKDYFKMMKGEYKDGINIEDMSMDLSQYIETYAGAAFHLGEHLTIGMRFKFLVGLQNGILNINKMTVADGQYSVHGDIKVNSITMDSSQYNIETNPEIITNDSFEFAKGNINNYGGAIDLGAEMRLLNNKLKLSAAVTDLGYIKWSSKSQMAGTIDWDVNENANIIDLIADFKVAEKAGSLYDYTTRLTTNVNLGAEYNFLGNHFALGLLSHTRIYNNAFASEITTSFNVRPTNWFTVTASHTFLNGNTPGIYGAAINFHPRTVNIFLGMDYIGDSAASKYQSAVLEEINANISPKATSYNFYIGIGFNFGRPDWLVHKNGDEVETE